MLIAGIVTAVVTAVVAWRVIVVYKRATKLPLFVTELGLRVEDTWGGKSFPYTPDEIDDEAEKACLELDQPLHRVKGLGVIVKPKRSFFHYAFWRRDEETGKKVWGGMWVWGVYQRRYNRVIVGYVKDMADNDYSLRHEIKHHLGWTHAQPTREDLIRLGNPNKPPSEATHDHHV